ncbi:MAG: thioredoxin family protein [Gammaproteobacteria bacterium]
MLTPSTMSELGSSAPAFALPGTDGRTVRSEDFAATPALLVAFMCNHCPYVKHIRAGFVAFAREYQSRGIAIVAINSNDAKAHPDDSPEMMKVEADRYKFNFPYLFDESQEVAKAFRAACTPDFFLYDNDSGLVYRGQFDGSRPGNGVPVTGASLREAVDSVLNGGAVVADQFPSIGCNIKWRTGNEPGY